MTKDDKIKEQPIIPLGWTYLAHGSNAARWNAEELGKDFTVSRPLCCVTKQEMESDKRHGFRGSTYTYSAQNTEPFQIRVLFFRNMIRYRIPECEQMQKKLSPDTINDIEAYYSYQGWRHSAVPSQTRLIKIAQTDYDEVYEHDGQTIYWYVPEKYFDAYKKALENERKPSIKDTLKDRINIQPTTMADRSNTK